MGNTCVMLRKCYILDGSGKTGDWQIQITEKTNGRNNSFGFSKLENLNDYFSLEVIQRKLESYKVKV